MESTTAGSGHLGRLSSTTALNNKHALGHVFVLSLYWHMLPSLAERILVSASAQVLKWLLRLGFQEVFRLLLRRAILQERGHGRRIERFAR